MVEKISYQDLEEKIKELESEIASLHQIKENYNALFYHSPFEIHIWKVVRDKKGDIRNWTLQDANTIAIKAWGRKLSEIAGKTPDEIFPETNPVELFLPIVEKIFSEKEPHLWEHYIPDTNQTLQMVSFPLEDTFFSVGLDISSLKKLEKDLLKSRELLEETSRIGKVGGWEVNIETGEVRLTDEVKRIHELDLDDEITLEEGINFYSDESKPVITKAVQRAIEDNEPYDLELEIITAKGNTRNVRAVGILDLRENRLFGFFQDITEKKKIQESQLRSSQLVALGEVAAGVAHEINNPINGIINYAQLLINKNDGNEKSTEILERILREGNRISSIVKNLLNFAQKDRGEFSSLNLMNIVSEPLNLNTQFFKKDGIYIDVGIPDDLPEIYGNRMQLEQVVLNLLINARHALNKRVPGQSNEKLIVIDATSFKKKNDEYVQLRIKDSGCGIPKNHIEKIFNPFFTTKEAGFGTGLGMSISHDILEKHGATISVESQVNKFTVVTITFPVKSEP